MANTKQSGSAAQRREQERQQRQRRDDGRFSTLSKGKEPNQGSMKRKKKRGGPSMVIGVLALIVAIIAAFIVISRLPASQTNTNPNLQATPANSTVVSQITGVSQATWEAIGTGQGVTKSNFQRLPAGQPLLKGPNGRPEFFYVGGEFCPYCAAQRWAIINALSRFGSFSNLSQLQAYEHNISTFSFHGSSYTSQYIDFDPKEIEGNQIDSSGQSYVPLEKMTPAEQQTFLKYNSAGSFPFIDIGNKYIAIGSTYPYTTLLTSSQQDPLSWQDIASSLGNPKSPVAQGILGSANYMTAAICNVTNQQPGSVCSSSVIQQIERTLNKTSRTATGSSQAIVPADRRAAPRLTLG